RFPGFDADKPTPRAQSYLLDRFARQLQVKALPRTFLIEIRFRCHDPALAAEVVNELIHSFMAIERQTRLDATSQASSWLAAQLGNPEQVLASNPDLQAEMGPGGAALAQKLRSNASEIAVELAQLKAEHGVNYPRVVELERAQADISTQIKAEDENLVEAFHR